MTPKDPRSTGPRVIGDRLGFVYLELVSLCCGYAAFSDLYGGKAKFHGVQ